MAISTRSHILEYLRKNQIASADELSSSFGKTGANIRYHLAILVSDEFVQIVGQRKDRRGRPVKLYGLSRRMLGDGSGTLAEALLDTWLNRLTEEEQERKLRTTARLLMGSGSGIPSKSGPGQIGKAINRLNELHYHARWEAGAVGPKIILGNCPYAAIIANHPELCRMDRLVLEEMLGRSYSQTDKLRTAVRSLPFCAFQVAGNKTFQETSSTSLELENRK